MKADTVNHSLKAQDLLYKRPLFKYIGQDEADMNVLVIGWRGFSEAFVDQCLQAGQMYRHFLKLTILVTDAEVQMQKYLSERPALNQFVNVNGSLDNADKNLEIYAEIQFKEFDVHLFDTLEDEHLENCLIDILADAPNEKYHYFVVDLKDDLVTKKVAENLSEAVDAFMPSERSAIHYVTEDKDVVSESDGIIPVYMDDVRSVLDIHPELERMAYNAHLAWDDAINGDALAELEKFRADSYNYFASVALALSIPYKLADIGIEMENIQEAAEAFWQVLKNKEYQNLIHRLIALEHRRWVIDRVCQGWKAPEPLECQKFYDDCIKRMKVKDVEKKIHPCIVRSTEKTPLSAGVFGTDRTVWNYKNEVNDAELDDLDRMSVELHRRMFNKAEAYRKTSPLEKGEIPQLYECLKKHECSDNTLRELERFVFCVKNILDGNYAYSKQYNNYVERFVSKLDVDDGVFNEMKCLVDGLSKNLWPVIEANLYRDYKKNDEVLVRKIPFILTYNIHLSLAMAFRTTDSLAKMNENIFKNVASATIIKPERVTYLLFLDETARVEIVQRMIRIVRKYMSGKGIHCQLDFLVTGLKDEHENTSERWKRCFDKLKKSGHMDDYYLQFVNTDQDAVDFWALELNKRNIDLFDGTTNLFQSMFANGSLLQIVRERYPYFEFDSRTKTFRKHSNCQFLSYIEDHTYLGIEEMFGLVGAEDMEFNYPLLGNEYRKLWNIYIGRNRGNKNHWKDHVRQSIKCWNVMCDTLEDYSERYPHKEIINLKELQEIYKGYQRWNDILNIIKELAGESGGKHYLIPERTDGKIIGFRYSDADIKAVLTKAGEILEIYTYFTLCEKGWFDEIACGYRFRWEKEKVNNELDLVLTKGFQSCIIECKARSKLDQNFYFKLNSLVDMFGIGAHKVLLTTANTDDDEVNRMQRERGNMMGITTLSEIEDLQNIAEKLMELL